jgi:polyisoprenoid-binding protein YceI
LPGAFSPAGLPNWRDPGARFTRFDAKLQFDPASPATAQVTVTIDPASITPDNPPPGFVASLRGAQWVNAAQFSKITYRSTRVEPVGPNAMRIFGDLTLGTCLGGRG